MKHVLPPLARVRNLHLGCRGAGTSTLEGILRWHVGGSNGLDKGPGHQPAKQGGCPNNVPAMPSHHLVILHMGSLERDLIQYQIRVLGYLPILYNCCLEVWNMFYSTASHSRAGVLSTTGHPGSGVLHFHPKPKGS